jgi:hypothetical protein
MRTLSDALLAAQKKSSEPAPKIVLTSGATSYTLEADRIKSLNHYFDPDHVYAKEVELDNSDGYFTGKDLKGYTAVISHGLLTKSGKEYADTSPMTVTWQQLNSSPGKLTCLLTMLGIPDMMALDESSANYFPLESDTKTVKTLLTEITTATLACFSHCQAYEIVFDSEDSLINSYCPKDSFRIPVGGNRWTAFKRLIERTGCVHRFEDDGKIHIFVPTTSGTTYNYEYSLDSGHPFFSKAYRKSLVIPNYVVVQSRTDDDPQYTGYAQDTTSYALLPKRDYYDMRLASNAEATSIASAVIIRAQLNAKMGSASVPVNCGAELFDYIKVTDEREADFRTGNLGSLSFNYSHSKREYLLNFSLGDPPINTYLKDLYQSLTTSSGLKELDLERLRVDKLYVDEFISLDDIQEGTNYKRVLSNQITAGKILLSDACEYAVGYDPDSKSRTFTATPTTPYDVGDIWMDTSTVKRCTTARATGAYVAGDWTATTLDAIANGTTYSRVKTTSLSASGLVLLDQVVIGTTYGLVYKTDISAGHILLSACIASGEWYSESGVIIDATKGIRLYGTDMAFATFANATDARAGTNYQTKMGSDGKLYAGAGAVSLDAAGLKIEGQYLIFNYGGVFKGVVYAVDAGHFRVAASAAALELLGNPIICMSPLTFGSACYIDLPQRTSHPIAAEGRMYLNSSDHNIYAYINGSWQTLHNY